MPTEYNAFPITGRKTSEFTSDTLNAAAQLIFWNGTTGVNLKRIGRTDFINELNKSLTAPPETLSGNKTIGASDKFIQILITTAARTITVSSGISCFIHNASTSTNTLTIASTVLLAGESAFAFWDGTSAHTIIKLAASGSSNLDISETDFGDATYYYYGGLTPALGWQVNRYLKATLATKTTANVINNVGTLTLSAAWSGRTGLTYA